MDNPINFLRPDELSLDIKNPRFGLHAAANEEEALSILVETADLKELWNSISVRGFESFEPLVATREDDNLVVLEGNRRLAAVKLLLEPSYLPSESRKKIPEVSAEKIDTCRKLPVLLVPDRAAANGYIGFKHVNGPARWSSLAKARFGVNFFESLEGRLAPRERLQSLAKQLGDSRGVIIRLLVSYKIVEQARNLGYFEQLKVEESNIEFSHLYTLINNPQSRQFIGLSSAPLNEDLIVSSPIPATHHGALLEVLGWLYGKNSVIKAQGTDRPRLQKVLASSVGLEELRLSGDLAQAAAAAGIVNEDWLQSFATIVSLTRTLTADAAQVADSLDEEQKAQARSYVKRIVISMEQIAPVIKNFED